MKASQKNKVVTYLVQNVALVMLAETESEPSIRKAAENHRVKLFTELPKDEHDPIFMMRNIMLKLAKKLVNCQSVDELIATEHLMEELIAGRILIVDDATGDYLQAQMNAQDGNGSGN
ncbi:hypothetical protein [Larkinella punicea]|uniref:Uncharacterized protein n=1 Tax=Larkinella punicea TaxID=2315727 RepID=A0A368JP42_9BACT|nr:hypothetical protein [Larkinella punicea]RCR69437.1 hypothetical protein DUE52_11330 [Larkinella punicea]